MTQTVYLLKHKIDQNIRLFLRRPFKNDNAYVCIQHFIRLVKWSLGRVGTAVERPIPPALTSFRFKRPAYRVLHEENLETWIARLDFRTSSDPVVSIIIPAYNNPVFIMECLVSLAAYHDKRYPAELILADDCSPDNRLEAFSAIKGVKYFKNSVNLGYIRNCNKAASLATAPYIVFLNSDVVVFANWLAPLVDAMTGNPDIGTVGPMLLNDDGSLQESGSMLNQDLRPRRLGNMGYPDDPEYNVPMKVDYCSGACLATRRSAFEAVGGFSDYLLGAYWDDVDYCLKLNQIGFSTWRIPASKVLHHENASYSKKKYIKFMERNYRKMREIWLRENQ